MLEFAEVGLAFCREDVPDLTAKALFDQHVTVHEGLTETLCDDAPYRGLTSTHEADENRHHLPSCFPYLSRRDATMWGMLSLLPIRTAPTMPLLPSGRSC